MSQHNEGSHVLIRGKFITIDGGECAGKGGIITELQKILPQDKVVFTREPGGTEIGEKLREFMFNPENKKLLSGWMIALLMNVARSANLDQVVVSALSAGKHVICDRFHMSTFAYQGDGGVYEALWRMDPYLLGKRFLGGNHWTLPQYPDVGIFIDVPPSVELARQCKRNPKDQNSFDSKDLMEITERYNRYKQIISDITKNIPSYEIKVVNGNRDEEVVKREVVKLVCDTIGYVPPSSNT